MSNLKKCLLLLGSIIPVIVLNAQLSKDVRVSNVDVCFFENRVYIPYTLSNGSETDRYMVWVEVFNQNDKLIAAKSLSGDVDIVKGNGNKVIFWDAKSDGFVLDEKLYVKVHAKLLPEGNAGKAFAYSTLYPGAGQYQYRHGKPHWIKGAAAYGLVGGGLGLLIMGNAEYSKYRNSDYSSADDPNFSKSKEYKQASIIMLGMGATIWLLDYAGLLSKSTKQKKMTSTDIRLNDNYVQFTALSGTNHISMRGLPPDLYGELQFSDINGNGILEAGEKAEIKITLTNKGNGDAMDLEVFVKTNMNDKSLTIVNPSSKITRLKTNEKREIVVPLLTTLDLKTATHKFSIRVAERFGYDMDTAFLVLNTYAYQPPKFSISGHEIIDIGTKTYAVTPDSKLQAGEQVWVKLFIQNTGLGMGKNARYQISTTDPNIFLDVSAGELGNVMPGEVKEVHFTLSPNKRVTGKNKLPIFITITEEIGRGSLRNEQLPIMLDQTPPKPNIVEVKSDLESLNKNIARFETTGNKFKTNITNTVNVASFTASSTKRPKSVGIVIGVSKYKELPPAPYADNDARLMKEYFEKVLGVEQVLLFTNEQVSGFFFDNIFDPEAGQIRKAITNDESEVFVYYSGHGIPDKEGKNIFLFPHDGMISRLETQGFNMEKLYENLGKIGAKHVTVIADACFSGASRSSGMFETENLISQKGVRVRPLYRWIGDPKFTVITSSTGEETSLGFDATETGLFTYFLAAGLMGHADANADKTITLGELKAYVTNNVTETSIRILGKQTPMFFGNDDNVLVTY